MWMMGYNDGGEPFSGRKLRTIVPRPGAVINPTCLGRIHGSDLLSFNQHLAAMTEQSRRDFNPQQVVVSSRWNPTPEQLQTLEELYRRGTRTPSAEEIQQITAQLRRYGKIEGKNVFYWFQNHKARERQKRRRRLESTTSKSNSDDPAATTGHNNSNNNVVENTERKEDEEIGGNGTGIEAEGTKNWPSSTTLAEKTGASIQRRAEAALTPECRVADGWVHFDEEDEAAAAEFQQRNKNLDDSHHHHEGNATWMMQYFSTSCCSSSISPISSTSPTNPIINSSTCSIINSAISTIPVLTPPSRTALMDHKQSIIKTSTSTAPYDHHHHHHHHQFLPGFFMNPYRSNEFLDDDHQDYLINHNSSTINIHEANRSDQTLQLFPLRNTGLNDNEDVADKDQSHLQGSVEAMDANMNNNTPPYKFFEFLPLKN